MFTKFLWHIKKGSFFKVLIKKNRKFFKNIFNNVITQTDFPLGDNGKLLLFTKILTGRNSSGLYPLIYKEKQIKFSSKEWFLPKTETLEGDNVILDNKTIEFNEDTVLPIGISNPYSKLQLNINGKLFNYNYFYENRYNYFKFNKGDKVILNSTNKVILGTPLQLTQTKKTKYKLVLEIFIDGLTHQVLKNKKILKLMPNTAKFFNDGSIFESCFSNGEWTLPSVAAISSGKYTVNHKLFHTSKKNIIGNDYKIGSEIFQQNGYMTFQACQNWRRTPSYGYAKGFDRSVYRSAVNIGLDAHEVNASFFEQLSSFPERSHYVWLSYFELHNVFYNILPDISSQINNSFEAHSYNKNDDISVFLKKDKKYEDSYSSEIKRLDRYLGDLYSFLNENYSENEYLICLVSDHGQSYLDDGKSPLRINRSNVPLMFKGKDIPKQINNDLVENVDILPTLLNLSGITSKGCSFDGKQIKSLGGSTTKEYTYTESLYPGQTYKACIRDSAIEFHYETTNIVSDNTEIDNSSFNVSMVNRLNNSAIIDDSLKTKYLQVIDKHINNFTKG